jgi:hypothetical protein
MLDAAPTTMGGRATKTAVARHFGRRRRSTGARITTLWAGMQNQRASLAVPAARHEPLLDSRLVQQLLDLVEHLLPAGAALDDRNLRWVFVRGITEITVNSTK